MQKMKLVIVGNGMAAARTLEELLKLAPDLYDITVFGAEPWPNYNRIMLSPVLAGEQTIQDIILNDEQWYADRGVHLHLGKTVIKIDRKQRSVTTGDGMEAPYDRLLLATGSKPLILPIPGNDVKGVISYRDIRDTETMIEASQRLKRAVVIGGGLLGLEAANGLAKRGMHVTVVHLSSWLMNRQLDKMAARMLQNALEKRGIHFLLGKSTVEVLGKEGSVTGLRFKDGSEVDADLVVMALGIQPDTALAESAGIHCNRGIVVNDTLQTFDPCIYAVGECVNHRGTVYGLVAPVYEQAQVCANHLAELGTTYYKGSIVSTKLKVTGINLFSAGNFMGDDESEDIVLSDPSANIYKRICIKDNKIEGAVMYGDTANSSWYFKLLSEGRHIDNIRGMLMFGELSV